MKDRGKEVKDRERSEAGGRRSGGLRGRWGSLGLRGEGVRSGGSSLLPPTVFSGAETAGGWGGGASPRGEEAAGGKREGTGRGSSYLGLRPPPPGRRARRGSRRPPPAPARSPTPLLPRAPSRLGPASRAQPAAPPALPPGRSGSPVAESRRSRARAPQAGRADGREAGSGTAAPWRGRGEAGAAAEGASGGGAAHCERFVSCPHPTPCLSTNTSFERQLVFSGARSELFGEEEACVTVRVRESLGRSSEGQRWSCQ